MNLSERKGPAVFVFAHQDDEIAYISRLKSLVREGRELRLFWLTDGSGTAPPEVRKAESIAAMRMVGVDEEKLCFIDYPDKKAVFLAREILERLIKEMAAIQPTEIYTVAYEGGHPDHDMAHFLAVEAASRLDYRPAIFEAPLYNACGRRMVMISRFVPAETDAIYTPQSREDFVLKVRAMFKYRSQFWCTVLPVLLFGWRGFFSPGEPYREVPAWNYLQPPHEGRLFYEGFLMRRLLGVSFADFRKAVSEILARPR